MSYKTIVTCITEDERYRGILAPTARLAEMHGAHLSVLCLGLDRTYPGAYYAGAQAIALQANMEHAQEEALAAEAAVEAALGNSTVPWDTQTIVTQTAALTPAIAERTVLADLVVLPKPYAPGSGVEDTVIVEAALFSTRVPVLILPDETRDWVQPKRVTIAWNQSPEALAAIRGAMDLLTAADAVDIAIIDPPRHAADRSDPGGPLAQMLSRHGIRADISVLAKTIAPGECGSRAPRRGLRRRPHCDGGLWPLQASRGDPGRRDTEHARSRQATGPDGALTALARRRLPQAGAGTPRGVSRSLLQSPPCDRRKPGVRAGPLVHVCPR